MEGGSLIFESKKSGDYHKEMTGEVFKTWFLGVLPKLESNSVIIMDNAPYHSVKLDRVPVQSWLRKDIISWLEAKDIPYDKDMVKAELVRVANIANVGHKYDTHVIDSLAKQAGHTVVRLPPYHCMLNPIEMIWSRVKDYVAENNKTFKLRDIWPLVENGLDLANSKWKKCIEHVVTVEENKFWEMDGLCDTIVDRLVITSGESTSSSCSESDE